MVEEVSRGLRPGLRCTADGQRVARVSCPASAASSASLARPRSVPWNRRSPARARPSCRPCRVPNSVSAWRRSPPVSPRADRRREPTAAQTCSDPTFCAGRVALVTGGGTGIGYGIAASLAAAGAEVAIASRKPEHLEPAAERLRAGGAKVSTVEVNVREPESVARMVGQVGEQARPARHPGQQRGRQLLRSQRRRSAPMPGARSSKPTCTAPSTVARPRTRC